ncbi:MAG: phenylacetate--CoA ligase [Methanobrevibacter sp.]|jgi:phenylacetate-CoA ligase|nr:phenylacetate--CoA ligase [Candidatus Methanovirga australis]
MIWAKEETLSREELEELQLKKLQKIVKRVYDNVPYYHKKYNELNVFPEDIQQLEDIQKLPFTTKDDLREAYPFKIFAVDQKKIIEIHSSSGTSGKPVISGYTKKDLDLWSEVVARGLTMMGIDENDVIQNTHGYGLFTGGFGIHYGSQKIGATVIPISTGQSRRQIEILKDLKTTVFIFTPSYGMYLGELAKEEGIDLKSINLKAIGFGAEMWTEEMRNKIEKTFHAPAYNIYGLTEIIGPGVAMECKAQKGLHISEDIFYPEIINSKTEEVLGENKEGELIITNLEREGMAIIRFRTKDISSITYESCSCGRKTARISKIKGRTDDMIKVKGVSIFPSQVEKALFKVNKIEPNYQIIVKRPKLMDEIEIKVEASKELFFDEIKEIIRVKRMIRNYIENETGLRFKVSIVEPKSLPISDGKAKRVIDERNLC